jgi:hypothetical protein
MQGNVTYHTLPARIWFQETHSSSPRCPPATSLQVAIGTSVCDHPSPSHQFPAE